MTRRKYGEGGVPIWNARENRWKVNYVAADGSRKTVTSSIPGAAGDADVREKRRRALDLAAGGDLPIPAHLTVTSATDKFFGTFIEGRVRPDELAEGVSPKTVADYRQKIAKWITPAIGMKPLDGPGKVGPSDVQTVLNRMVAAKVSPSTRQSVFDLLRRALDAAIEDGNFRGVNPAKVTSVKRPVRDHKPFEPWTDAEMQSFLDSVVGDPYEAMWNIAAYLGPRQGEVIGLRKLDVDFTARTITFAGQLSKGGTPHHVAYRKGGAQAVTHENVPGWMLDLVKVRLEAQRFEERRAGADWSGNPDGLIFTLPRHGTPMGHSRYWKEWVARIKAVKGLRYTKPHGTRHYAGSLQVAGGATDGEGGAFLGHRDNGQTFRDNYKHLRREQTSVAAMDRIEAVRNRRTVTG